jgi:hypothetical protein
MTDLIKLHEKLGLHQELHIVYVVDGYQSILYLDDNNLSKNAVQSDCCETIYLSLLDLERKLHIAYVVDGYQSILGRIKRKL